MTETERSIILDPSSCISVSDDERRPVVLTTSTTDDDRISTSAQTYDDTPQQTEPEPVTDDEFLSDIDDLLGSSDPESPAPDDQKEDTQEPDSVDQNRDNPSPVSLESFDACQFDNYEEEDNQEEEDIHEEEDIYEEEETRYYHSQPREFSNIRCKVGSCPYILENPSAYKDHLISASHFKLFFLDYMPTERPYRCNVKKNGVPCPKKFLAKHFPTNWIKHFSWRHDKESSQNKIACLIDCLN